MRITILWARLASYSVALFRELALNQGCNIQLIFQPSINEAPYQQFDLSFCDIALEDYPDIKNKLESLVQEFAPDCVLMSSWTFKHFMRLTKKLRRKGVLVISAMDNQWHGTIKQWLGVFSSRWFLKPSIDNFLVAGDRQAYFARKLGYDDVLYGLYAVDVGQFVSDIHICERPKYFLFVGRLVSVKGVKNLIQAYKRYREKSSAPWGLKIAGDGELRYLIEDVPGVEYIGFVQPDKVPLVMQNSSCFVLPSLWEPWGVVIHEAASAGLPIIATYPCGAITTFVRDGLNGYVIPPKIKPLTEAMLKISYCDDEELEEMSENSLIFAKFLTPRKLAKYFVKAVERFMSGKEL